VVINSSIDESTPSYTLFPPSSIGNHTYLPVVDASNRDGHAVPCSPFITSFTIDDIDQVNAFAGSASLLSVRAASVLAMDRFTSSTQVPDSQGMPVCGRPNCSWTRSGVTTAPPTHSWSYIQVVDQRVSGDPSFSHTKRDTGDGTPAAVTIVTPYLHFGPLAIVGVVNSLDRTFYASEAPTGSASPGGNQLQMDLAPSSTTKSVREYLDLSHCGF
jgi:hypothetical protein